jgi:type II secretory pathway pseudopilin PulG
VQIIARNPALRRCKLNRLQKAAFSLIEMIGVATVLLLIALALTPILIKYFDRLAAEKESLQLKQFADAFRQSVIKSRSITNGSGWAVSVANIIGVTPEAVLVNERRVARVFLIDRALQINGANPFLVPSGSYVQSANGAWPQPVSPRVMILSSISDQLTNLSINGSAMGSGSMLQTSDYSNLWNTAEGELPTGWGGVWKGKGDDLQIQRIHLGDLFLQLVLNNRSTNFISTFTIDGLTNQMNPGTTFSSYFLDSTQITLLGTNGNVEYSEILHEAKHFISDGTWRPGGYFGRTIHHPDPLDLQLVADAFLSDCQDNPHTKFGTTRSNVYTAMINFMANFIYWRDNNPSYNNSFCCAPASPLPAAQDELANRSLWLINK